MIKLIRKNRFDNLSFKDLIVDDNNKEVVDYLKDYCKNVETKINNSENIILSGTVGVGKTMMSRIFKNELEKVEVSEEIKTWEFGENVIKENKRNLNVKYIRCNDLIQVLREHFDKNKSENFEYHRCDFLIIDEIGVQYNTDGERICLYKLFDHRYEHYKPIMIISNNKIKTEVGKKTLGLDKILGSRILDRIYSDDAKYFFIQAKSKRRGIKN